jgi:hypothetical protein
LSRPPALNLMGMMDSWRLSTRFELPALDEKAPALGMA